MEWNEEECNTKPSKVMQRRRKSKGIVEIGRRKEGRRKEGRDKKIKKKKKRKGRKRSLVKKG